MRRCPATCRRAAATCSTRAAPRRGGLRHSESFPGSGSVRAFVRGCAAEDEQGGGPLMLDPAVFKAYDVRGLYPSEVDEEGAYAIGRAYVEQFEPRRIAVGRDVRLSSPSMAAAAIEGAADGGAAVVDIGMVGTEMLYFAVGELGLDGGVMVTASHNPKEYTGMKIVRRGALPVGGESGLFEVRDRAVRGEWRGAGGGSGTPEGGGGRVVERGVA